jgi:5'-deoxynucleotidase YfbR-like HD superfamily hydrolase
MSHACIDTFLGVHFDLLEPRPKDIHIEDIAHALSNLSRFTGHCRRFYSVAEHSLNVASYLPDRWKLSGLLHDAAEAYIGDMTRALKHHTLCGQYFREVEWPIEQAIQERFQLPEPDHELIKAADNAVLKVEQEQLMHNSAWPHQRHSAMIRCLPPPEAEQAFLKEFYARQAT